ncbi:hypothetical protein ID866_9015 [Astraeus odoratus]|nr:hypothetical protein ID866_9015 [Astraeus odoratus]
MRRYTYRENLAVTPSEIPLIPDDQPVYKDQNIAVFALPVLPVEDGEEDKKMLEISANLDGNSSMLKRKRDGTPESSDRLAKRGPSLTRDTMNSESPPSIQELASRAGFDPTSLTGDAAQAWRRYIVDLMFPATRVAQSTAEGSGKGSKGKKKGKGNTAEPSADEPPKSAYVCQPASLKRALPLPERASVGSPDQSLRPTVAYAIHGPRVRGKFDAEKAAALGLKSGPLRAALARGQTVTVKVDDGHGNTFDREIKPADCIAEGTLPGVILVLDTPTVAHIPHLLAGFVGCGPFAKYCEVESKDHIVRVVYHLCGDGVLEDERYKAFMNEFGPEVHHLVASRRHLPDPVTFTSAAYSQLRLNQLDPNVFPLPKFSLTSEKSLQGMVIMTYSRTLLEPPITEPLYLVAHHSVFQYLRDYEGLERLGLQTGSSNPVITVSAEAIHWTKGISQSTLEEACRGGPKSGLVLYPMLQLALTFKGYARLLGTVANLCASLGLRSLQTIDVEHRTLCHGLIIKHMSGWSIVFVAVTLRLCPTLSYLAATMADEEADKARVKMHSTIGQAIDIGKKMNAYSTLLTHFSARYPTMPPTVLGKHEDGDPILALAFDHANITIGDMRKMHAYMAAIQQNFADLEDDDAPTQVAEVDIT